MGDRLPSPWWDRIFWGTRLVEIIGEGYPPVLLLVFRFVSAGAFLA